MKRTLQQYLDSDDFDIVADETVSKNHQIIDLFCGCTYENPAKLHLARGKSADEIDNWIRHHPSKILFIFGPYGCGKTTEILRSSTQNSIELFDLQYEDLKTMLPKHNIMPVGLSSRSILLIDNIDEAEALELIPQLPILLRFSRPLIVAVSTKKSRLDYGPLKKHVSTVLLKAPGKLLLNQFSKQLGIGGVASGSNFRELLKSAIFPFSEEIASSLKMTSEQKSALEGCSLFDDNA